MKLGGNTQRVSGHCEKSVHCQRSRL